MVTVFDCWYSMLNSPPASIMAVGRSTTWPVAWCTSPVASPLMTPAELAVAVLATAPEVQANDTEPGTTPSEGAVMVVINASDDPRTLNLFGDQTWTLHPVQAASADAVVRTATHGANGFFVPARTTAVFRRASQTSCAPFSRDIFVRGVGADWAASPANQLQFLGGTIYQVTKTLAAS